MAGIIFFVPLKFSMYMVFIGVTGYPA